MRNVEPLDPKRSFLLFASFRNRNEMSSANRDSRLSPQGCTEEYMQYYIILRAFCQTDAYTGLPHLNIATFALFVKRLPGHQGKRSFRQRAVLTIHHLVHASNRCFLLSAFRV